MKTYIGINAIDRALAGFICRELRTNDRSKESKEQLLFEDVQEVVGGYNG